MAHVHIHFFVKPQIVHAILVVCYKKVLLSYHPNILKTFPTGFLVCMQYSNSISISKTENQPMQVAIPESSQRGNKDNSDKDGIRTSRRLLANAQSIPTFLTDRWPIPDGVTVSHTTHVDSTLPLFQARLARGSHEGKSPSSKKTHSCLQQLLFFYETKCRC